ncbi:hypothetical protein [Spiroplasma endosymbiont of Stenodema calcarata]|uniref:hypothetical protein n=1 Tax=Spiroplasma endosymbiont of Stenodema calcarata TaxID=3139328 RepID=UPI003CCADFBA
MKKNSKFNNLKDWPLTDQILIFSILISESIGLCSKPQFHSIINSSNSNKNICLNSEAISNDIFYHWYGRYTHWTTDSSIVREAFNWKKYEPTWKQFSDKYRFFMINSFLNAKIESYSEQYGSDFLGWTAMIGLKNKPFNIVVNYFYSSEFYTALALKLWLDGDNIYWKWEAYFRGRATNSIQIKLNYIIFYKNL